MARPREDHVETRTGVCARHGEIEFRRHKVGKRKGVQRYRWRCPECHARARYQPQES